jgi:isopenicillin N synthase-like dioxygenase
VTVLLQDIIEPLHVRGKEGCWIEASPILGSIPANCSARDQRLCPCQSR